MRFTSVLLAVGCLVSAVSGQWLETTLYLPDSFGGLMHPLCFVHDSANNTIYVGGATGGRVIAIDGATNQRKAGIETGTYASALCANPRDNKVYSVDLYDSSVTVIDGATNQVLTTVAVGRYPGVICYNSVSDKVYCTGGEHYDPRVTVIDGVGDSVLRVLLMFS